MQNKMLKDFLKVVSSNLISLASGVTLAFLLPKIISVIEFGYYKTFMLYVSYVGLLHFGFCDGIYLKYGGCNYSELDSNTFKVYFKFLFLMEFIVSIVIVLFSFFFISENLKFIFYSLSIYSFIHILSTYYRLLSEATSRFNESSIRITAYSLLRVMGVVFLGVYSLSKNTFVSHQIFIIGLIIIETILLVSYYLIYKDISFGNTHSFNEKKYEIFDIFRIGLPLLITNIAATVLLVLDRQFVNLLFPKDQYAIYAFAYNLLALVTTTTSAISVILFPKLKQNTETELKNRYTLLVSLVLVIVYAGMLVYFPLCIFIKWFLPSYTDSLNIFRIIFPGLAVSSVITVVIYNYYKVLNIAYKFLKINLLILLVSAIANYVAYSYFHTTSSISYASILTMILWYILTERPLIKVYSIGWRRNFMYMLLLMLSFYLITLNSSEILGFFIYFLLFIALTFIFQRNYLLSYLKNYMNIHTYKK